ncbi:unnamed protein product [Closterium sp. NIES-54]
MDWFHYVLVSVNLCLLVLVLAESLPSWVTSSDAGAELAAAGGASGRLRGEWSPLFPMQLRKSLLVAHSSDETGDTTVSPFNDPVLQSSAPATIHATATGVASSIFDGSVAPLRRRVCWTSSGDYFSTSPSGVVIHGSGCATCLRGQRCSFRVSVRAPARWAHVLEADKESWWKRDLALTLRGIALAHGDIRCLDPPHCTEFRVSYRVWDLGNYWATLHVGCANLNFSASFTHHFNRTHQHSLASWPITITPRGEALNRTSTLGISNGVGSSSSSTRDSSRRIITPAAAYSEAAGGNSGGRGGSEGKRHGAGEGAGEGTGEGAGEGEGEEEEGVQDWPDTPCNGTSVPGRWVVKADGSLRWAFYRCAAPEIPPSEWIGALHERGIREISIVGDSHQRFLAAHLHFLLTAQADKDVKRWQDNLVFDARDSSNRTLRINFYWIDGIYKNGEFGCTHRGVTTNRSEEFPEISTTADVTLFEGGYWAASFCRQPLKALRVHLEEFARWALAAAPAKGRVIFRTIPSFPVVGDRCKAWYPGPSSNRVVMAINVLLKQIVQGRGGAGEGRGVERLEAGRLGGIQERDVGGEGGRSGGGIEKLVYLDSSLQALPRDSEEEGEGMERAGDESNGATESKGAADIEEVDEIAAAGGADGGAGAGGGKSYSEKRPPPPSPRAAAEAPSSELAALPAGAATVLDTWQVDAPRYADTAEPHDHHYSMVKPTKEGTVVVGEVGEAQVRAFIHYLLRVI